MASPSSVRVRRAAPLVASAAVVTTLVTCFILTRTRHLYTGGLTWPYFSDMGRDPPGYYVFCVGLTTTALALIATWWFNYEFQRAVLRRPRQHGHVGAGVGRAAIACLVLGTISTPGLPVLAFFSTSSYPKLHNYSAYWFFFLETFAIFLNTFVSFRILKSARCPESCTGTLNAAMPTAEQLNRAVARFKRTFTVQAVFTVFFFIAFLLYLPIGLAVIKPFKRLTVDECLERDLGTEYCTVTMRYNSTETKLWNYEDDYAATQMRAAGQLGCILTLVGYSVSFLTHSYGSDDASSPRPSTNEDNPDTHFHAIAMLTSPEVESGKAAVVRSTKG